MKCDEARERMVFFVDGEDDAVGEHVGVCSSCGRYRDDVAAERNLIRGSLRPLLRAEGGASEGRPRVRRPQRVVLWPWVAAAAVVLVVLGVVAWPEKPKPQAITKTEPKPEPPSVVVPEEKPEPPAPAPEPKPEPKPEEPRPEPPMPEPPKPEEPEPEPKPEPEPPRPEPKPTEPAKIVKVELALEKGSTKNLKWERTWTFSAGDSFQAKTAMRVAWHGATVYVQENSSVTVLGDHELALDAGEVLVESAGAKLSIKAGAVVFANTGTRYLVEVEGKTASATVYEGRVQAGDREVVAGERWKAGKIESAKDAYPAWMARAMAKRTPIVQYAFKSPDKRWYGTLKDGALHGIEKEGLCYTGVDSADPLFVIPAKGEYSVTYFVESGEPLTLRLRALKPGSTAFDHVIEKPVVGKAVTVRLPLDAFTSFEGKKLAAGDRIHILYVFAKEMRSKLRIDDLTVSEVRE